jgi:hypothetical protein
MVRIMSRRTSSDLRILRAITVDWAHNRLCEQSARPALSWRRAGQWRVECTDLLSRPLAHPRSSEHEVLEAQPGHQVIEHPRLGRVRLHHEQTVPTGHRQSCEPPSVHRNCAPLMLA